MLVSAALVIACQKKNSSEDSDTVAKTDTAGAAPVTLQMKWQTEPLLTTCESVIYDKDNDILYVANINGAPDAKDGNGFIAKVSLDGQITDEDWVKGLDAPKGMGISDGKLYVADVDQVREIDIKSGKVTNSYAIQGAKFLNDITVGDGGKIYVSDTGTGVISVIEDGDVMPWLENVQGGPNGLLMENERMLVLSFQGGNLNAVDLSNMQSRLVTDSIENADGVESIGDGEYLVSSWNGMVHHISGDWTRTTVLDTRADSVNAADIEYIKEKNLLLVPAFFKNKVVAYEVSKVPVSKQ